LRENDTVIVCRPDAIPVTPGAYVLEIDLSGPVEVEAGRLGAIRLGPGLVRYYGNARGPGGLRARVRRHLDKEGRRDHWHIDKLTRKVPVARVLIEPNGSECEMVSRDLDSGHWEVAVAGFGSSDCRSCRAHLLIEKNQLDDTASR
jgi:Uri superfamily endonuclease